MRRLVVCCDGTWQSSDSRHVSNIAKIAWSVETRRLGADVDQVVHYVGGVGARYSADRWLGGAVGLGLLANLSDAYQFLALNYEPGDEVYVFGFSRGAYTARSLVGMIARVGLLRADQLDHLREAMHRYRNRAASADAVAAGDLADFRRNRCHPDVPIQFLGVFDTVGALGVPGPFKRRHQFHDIRLSRSVRSARQALAIDDRRMAFEPCLWELQEGTAEGQVEQVWFEGVHSDVGGGYAETALSDTALLWMVQEASAQGLVLNAARLAGHLDGRAAPRRHDSMKLIYRVSNGVRRLRQLVAGTPRFRGDVRVLRLPRDQAVALASAAAARWDADADGYRSVAPNVGWWHALAEAEGTGAVEDVLALPSARPVLDELTDRGVRLAGETGPMS